MLLRAFQTKFPLKPNNFSLLSSFFSQSRFHSLKSFSIQELKNEYEKNAISKKLPWAKIIADFEKLKKDIELDKVRESQKIPRINDIQELHTEIKNSKKPIRIIGAGHSAATAIFSGNSENDTRLKLDGTFRSVKFSKEKDNNGNEFDVVTVGGGCNLGVDPLDRDFLHIYSTVENSLIEQLSKKSYALPIVGGITHQTIGGFMLTGSAGGSLKHGFADCIQSFKFMNGKGEIIHAKRGTDIFEAVGVSMGLMGVITEVTLKLEPNYQVRAQEEVKEKKDSWLNKTKAGDYPLENVLKNTEYMHLNWIPLKDVDKVMQWEAARIKCEEDKKGYKQGPYQHPMAKWIDSSEVALFFTIIDSILRQENVPPIILKQEINTIAFLYRKFTDYKLQKCWEDWDKILPTEDQIPVDSTMQTLFTEIWFPVEHTTKLIDALDEFYQDKFAALGNYAVELYGAKSSPFWLSPAYGRDVIRVDLFWWKHNKSDPVKFFQKFFDRILAEIPDGRLHWGKYMPIVNHPFGSVHKGNQRIFNLDYLKQQYPKMNEWLKIREEMDPNQLFVTPYWRNLFNLQAAPKPTFSQQFKP